MLKIKIILDKYYTSPELAQYIINKTNEIIGEENITEYLEPSAGGGVFLDYLDHFNKPYLAYDIEPEDSQNRIVKRDFLKLDMEYKNGRCIIGNPPYGIKNTLSLQFYKKSVKLCDYISFILPISQLNNNIRMYEFDLIYSEDLGVRLYSDKELNCCFNIYKKPLNGINKKPDFTLNDVVIVEHRRGKGGRDKIPEGYDYAMGAFGAGCVGKPVDYIGTYALEFYFYINNTEIKNKVMELLVNTDWKSLSKGISNTYGLPQWRIYKYLREQIPEIE